MGEGKTTAITKATFSAIHEPNVQASSCPTTQVPRVPQSLEVVLFHTQGLWTRPPAPCRSLALEVVLFHTRDVDAAETS